jgi:hypothetical protein
MTCSDCFIAAARIEELERALEGAVYVLDSEVAKVQSALPLSPQQAVVVMLLWRAGNVFLSWAVLSDALPTPRERPQNKNLRPRIDIDFRSPGFGTSLIRQTRLKVGADFIETKVGTGYRLSGPARDVISKIVGKK